jgi:hypothetical protein
MLTKDYSHQTLLCDHYTNLYLWGKDSSVQTFYLTIMWEQSDNQGTVPECNLNSQNTSN